MLLCYAEHKGICCLSIKVIVIWCVFYTIYLPWTVQGRRTTIKYLIYRPWWFYPVILPDNESNNLKRKRNTNKDDNNTEKSEEKSWNKSLGEVNMGALHVCGAEGKDALSHADEEKSQWDRNCRVLFIHGQPSLKVLSLKSTCKYRNTLTVKNRHTQADTGTNTCISQYSRVHSILIQIRWQAETFRTRFALFITWNTFTSAAGGDALSKWNLSLLPISLTLHCSTS